jgi:hypothetical protein
VRKLPLVLGPAPKVYFVGFGDSSMNFTARLLSGLSDPLPLTHAVREEFTGSRSTASSSSYRSGMHAFDRQNIPPRR